MKPRRPAEPSIFLFGLAFAAVVAFIAWKFLASDLLAAWSVAARLELPPDPFRLVIAATLFAAGLGMAAGGYFGFSYGPGLAPPDELAPSEPIRGSSSRFPFLWWLGGLVVCGIVTAYGVHFVATRGGEAFGLLVLGLAELLGLYFLWRAILATLRWRRFGKLALQISPHPVRVGGPVSGTLIVPGAYDPGRTFKVDFACIERGTRTHASDTKPYRYEETRFEAQASARAGPAPEGTQLAFRFAVPADGLPSGDKWQDMPASWRAGRRPERASIHWTIRVSGPQQGVDLDETFAIAIHRARRPVPAQGTAAGPAPNRGLWPRRIGIAFILGMAAYHAWPLVRSHFGVQ